MKDPWAAAPLLGVGDAVWQHAAAQGLQVAAPLAAAGLVWRAAARSPAAERGPWRALAAALLLAAGALALRAWDAWVLVGRDLAGATTGLTLLSLAAMLAAVGWAGRLPAPPEARTHLLGAAAGGVVGAGLALLLVRPLAASGAPPGVVLPAALGVLAAAGFVGAAVQALARPGARAARGVGSPLPGSPSPALGTALAAAGGALLATTEAATAALRWLGLYSEVHPVGLVRLAGTVLAGAAPFLALPGAAASARLAPRAIRSPATSTPSRRPRPTPSTVRPSSRPPVLPARLRALPVRGMDLPFVASLLFGLGVGAVAVLVREHYTAAAMEVLWQAIRLAIQELEGGR